MPCQHRGLQPVTELLGKAKVLWFNMLFSLYKMFVCVEVHDFYWCIVFPGRHSQLGHSGADLE